MNIRLNALSGALLAIVSGVAIATTSAAPAHAGIAPSLSWAPATAPSSYGYGTIDVGDKAVQTFTLRNDGGRFVGLLGLTVPVGLKTSALKIALTGSNAYTITADTCSGKRLGPKKTCTVTVEYAPTTAGQTDTATLTATSTKPAASASHTLTGSATPAPANVTYRRWSREMRGSTCIDQIEVRGLPASTSYKFRATFTSPDGYVNTDTARANSQGEAQFSKWSETRNVWTFQAYDPNGAPVGEPSQQFSC